MTRRGVDYYKLALVGWIGVPVWVAIIDEWAVRTGRSTMSKGFGDAGAHPDIGPFTVGAWAGLCWHFTAEVIRAWRRRFG